MRNARPAAVAAAALNHHPRERARSLAPSLAGACDPSTAMSMSLLSELVGEGGDTVTRDDRLRHPQRSEVQVRVNDDEGEELFSSDGEEYDGERWAFEDKGKTNRTKIGRHKLTRRGANKTCSIGPPPPRVCVFVVRLLGSQRSH